MNGIDQETLAMLKKLLEETCDPVKQYLSGYVKGAADAMKGGKPAA